MIDRGNTSLFWRLEPNSFLEQVYCYYLMLYVAGEVKVTSFGKNLGFFDKFIKNRSQNIYSLAAVLTLSELPFDG